MHIYGEKKNWECLSRGRAGKVGSSAKVGLHVTAFLVCNVVKATVGVSTGTPVDISQRRICFFGTNAKW